MTKFTKKSTMLKRFLILTIVILITEYAIMQFLSLQKMPPSSLALIDSIILMVILFPALYLVIFKPFNQKIIEAKTAQDENERVLSELDQIFNTAASAMRVIEMDYTVSRVNRAFLDLVGVTQDECIGKKCYDIFYGPVCHTPDCTLKKVIEGDKRVEYEITKQCCTGKSVPCVRWSPPSLLPAFWERVLELKG